MPKILFFLEIGSPHFGIAKYIKENLDCEVFAIINTNKAKNFFLEQNLIKFTNQWFLRDNITNTNTNLDLEYLRKFEEKYQIDLWNVVYSDVTFREYNPYYTFSRDEILSVVKQICEFYEKILDQSNPDYLIIRPTDAIADQLLQMICKAKGVRVLTLGFARLGQRTMISTDMDVLEAHMLENFENVQFTQQELFELMHGYTKQQDIFRKKFRNSKLNWLKTGIEFLGLISKKEYRRYYAHSGRTVPRVIGIEISNKFKKIIRERFLDKNSIRKLPDEKFVYFSLGLEPERTILIPTPFYSNQLEVIKNLARALPIEYQLFVKEHPMQKVRGWREIEYYKEILDLPNVQLIHPSVTNEEITKKSSLVVAVVGTSTLEAAIFGKPSIVFGKVIHSDLPSVFRVKNLEELPTIINKALETKVEMKDVNKLVNIIMKNSFDYEEGLLRVQINDRLFHGGELFDRNISVEEIKAVLDEHEEVFNLLGEKHIEKIKFYDYQKNKDFKRS
ncbi:Capsule polysaccharide biosynthesis protein [Marine Group I thaumarchaeote SCGC AAA799-P11]|uniref:Capsule polysaccharide biosynthesis protein n=1 Tax=Marine Group I thaumarchaeote SCGC AAA799-P11 TaxID=1502295 RepID=A0A087S2Z1_9ARCH|nr:Capsule polysaccharide biosynthesis protein [Marine Group I thaumarchaeote SCGC AAA799-P11]